VACPTKLSVPGVCTLQFGAAVRAFASHANLSLLRKRPVSVHRPAARPSMRWLRLARPEFWRSSEGHTSCRLMLQEARGDERLFLPGPASTHLPFGRPAGVPDYRLEMFTAVKKRSPAGDPPASGRLQARSILS